MIKIAVCSGKGGTGKTTISVSLALALSKRREVCLVDCDVEEPNCHIFLSPDFEAAQEVTTKVPEVDADKCTACGECGRACRFNAIISLKTKAMVFPELCHGCGVCAMVCSYGAITEKDRPLGQTESAMVSGVYFRHGVLDVGEAMGTPVIRAVKRDLPEREICVFDSPPGTSCPMVATVKESDFAILVTEPTPFGLNDLKLAVETVISLGVPFGVVINRSMESDGMIEEYCAGKNIPLLMKIPDMRSIAEGYSRGEPLIRIKPELAEEFYFLEEKIMEALAK